MFDMLPLKMTRSEWDALPVVQTPQQELKERVGLKYKTPRLPLDPDFQQSSAASTSPSAWWHAEVVHISSYGAKIVYRPVEIVDAAPSPQPLDEESW